MCIKLILFLLNCISLSVSSTSILDCTPQPNGFCNIVSIDPVTQANEVITIAGQPSPYADPSITNLEFINTFALQYVPTSLFTTFPNLGEIDIKNCGTTTLVKDAYNNCGSLQVIILEGGNIPNVPAGFASTCSEVFAISLRNNSIATIDPNAFDDMTNLVMLSLDNNKLTCIPPTLFQKLPKISQITLTFNSISAIDSKIVSGLPDVVILDMSSNSLTYVPLLDLTGNTNNEIMFGFADNPITAINANFKDIFAGQSYYFFIFDNILCLPAGSTTSGMSSIDYTTSNSLSTCFSNHNPATMSESAPCLPITTTVATTTISSATTIQDLICVTYPEWKEILKNFHLPQWKKRCPRFHRKKVCLHICFFVPGGDGDNDRDDRHTNVPGHTHKPDHPNTIRPIFGHRPGYPHIHKPGLHNPGFLQQIRPGKKPFKG